MKLSILCSVLLALLLLGCGAEPKQDCIANFLGQGLSLRVSFVTGETYRFELCGDARTSYPAFTVYGAPTEAGLSQSTILTRYRLSHVTGNRSGDSFEVTFSSDLYFVIFADTQNGSSLEYSNTTELVRGSLAQSVVLNETLAFEGSQN